MPSRRPNSIQTCQHRIKEQTQQKDRLESNHSRNKPYTHLKSFSNCLIKQLLRSFETFDLYKHLNQLTTFEASNKIKEKQTKPGLCVVTTVCKQCIKIFAGWTRLCCETKYPYVAKWKICFNLSLSFSFNKEIRNSRDASDWHKGE